jgi:hypothetical protein
MGEGSCLFLLPDQPETRFSFIQERIQQIASQLPDLLNHHKSLHHSILRIYVAIAPPPPTQKVVWEVPSCTESAP